MAPDMDKLNKRRVDRQIRRKKEAARKRRQKTMITLIAVALMIIGGVGLFFVLRAEDVKETPVQEQVTPQEEAAMHAASEDESALKLENFIIE